MKENDNSSEDECFESILDEKEFYSQKQKKNTLENIPKSLEDNIKINQNEIKNEKILINNTDSKKEEINQSLLISNLNINNIQDKNSKIEIIENYFDFSFHDIDLANIERYYRTKTSLNDEKIKIIKLLLENFKKFISENLNQTTYPYLTNSIRPQFQSLEESNEQKKYFLIEILSQRNEIRQKMTNFFQNLTQINLYGIDPKLKNLFNKEVIESEDFKKFSIKLAKWHCHVEMILLYMDILSTFFNEKFNFQKYSFSLEKNFKNNTDVLIKKNFFKLAGTLCSKISLDPGIDYKKVLTFLLTSVTAGINLGGLSLIFPHEQICKILGIYGLNYIAGKVSNKLGSASDMVEFGVLSSLVLKLNKSLFLIEKLCYKLIISEMMEEIKIDMGESKLDYIKNKKNEISDKLKIYLQGVDFDIDIKKIVEEEFIVLQSSIQEETFNNDWVVQHLSISEVGKNENEKKIEKKEDISDKKVDEDNIKNEKDDDMISNFVDI